MLTYQFQNKRNQNLSEEWVDQQTIGKNSVRQSISTQFTSQRDKEKSSIEEVSVNNSATYDITRFNCHQNLSTFPEHKPSQSSETHISLGVENIVSSSQRRIAECKSEA